MFDFLKNAISEIKNLTWQNVAILLLLCIIGIGTFYTYKKIDSIEFNLEKDLSIKDKFFEEFGMATLETDLMIREILVSTRAQSGATNVSI